MLTLEYRPKTFRDMAGQDIVRKALLHIIKDPKNAPRTLLLCGKFGTGKTTSARIFARALNCPHQLPNGDACGRDDCPVCGIDIQDSMFYDEYDSAIVGKVESIRDLRNSFYFGYDKGYKVIVLDEIHLVSPKAQGALLKALEEPESNVFFLLCTTDPDKLLNTIVSRSFILNFEGVPQQDIINHLKKIIASREPIGISEDQEEKYLKSIALRSNGHMRNAMMLLDNLYLLKEDFGDLVQDSSQLFKNYLKYSLYYRVFADKYSEAKVDGEMDSLLAQLTTFPISNLKQDYLKLVLQITLSTTKESQDPDVELITKPFKQKFDLINILDDPDIIKLFADETQFQIAMVVISNKLKALKVKLA